MTKHSIGKTSECGTTERLRDILEELDKDTGWAYTDIISEALELVDSLSEVDGKTDPIRRLYVDISEVPLISQDVGQLPASVFSGVYEVPVASTSTVTLPASPARPDTMTPTRLILRLTVDGKTD